MKIDTHIHSRFSIDSKVEIDDICLAGIQKGMKAICITDHVDLDKRDYGYGFYKADEYFAELNRCKDKYKDRLLVLSGIEFSEPHLHSNEFKELSKYDYDMIMGSLHWMPEGFVGEEKFLANHDNEEIEELYYNSVLLALEYGGFDTLGHLDLFKRYTKVNSGIISEKLVEIGKLLIEKDIALEINTSSLRKGGTEYMPSDTIIKRYIDLGGKKITTGSDAHNIEDIGKDIDSVIEAYKDYLGIYINREFRYLKDL